MGAAATTEERTEQKAQRNAERHRASGRLPPRRSGTRGRAGGIGRGAIRNRPESRPAAPRKLLRCARVEGRHGRPRTHRTGPVPVAARHSPPRSGARQRRGGALLRQARHTQLVGVVLGVPWVLRQLTVTAVFGGEPGAGVRAVAAAATGTAFTRWPSALSARAPWATSTLISTAASHSTRNGTAEPRFRIPLLAGPRAVLTIAIPRS